MARIQLENVKKSFGKVQALNGITIDVKDKEFFVISATCRSLAKLQS